MADPEHAVIETFLSQQLGTDWDTDWHTLAELADRPQVKPRLAQLRGLFPGQDILAWSREELAFNLLRGPWDQLWGDQLPPFIARTLLTASLSLGVVEAIKLAKQAAGLESADGIMGPQTLAALNQVNAEAFLAAYRELIKDREQDPGASPERQSILSNQLAKGAATLDAENASRISRQAQTNPHTTDEIAAALEPFNVDAIAKKSTSDIWTIEDQLGYETYAQAIAKLILDGKAQPPLTISIQAPWGQGKTSLMRMIKHKLERGLDDARDTGQSAASQEEVPGTQTRLYHLRRWIKEEADAGEAMLPLEPGTIPCVWFNPLYFQNSNQVWSGLAHSILHQLVEHLPNQLEKERFWFRLQMARLDTHAIRRDIHKLILERWLPKGLVWLGLLILTLAYTFTDTQIGQYLQQHIWPQATPVVGAVGHFLYQWLNKNKDWTLDDKLARYIREPDYGKDMGLLHLVDHDLDRALTLLLGENNRTVVFIDDLDRCSPATVNEIMLAINQFISVQHRKLYFILGMDTHMVAMAIESASEKQAETYNRNRHTSKGYGWRFMEKFVQLPFFIPRIQPPEARKFMDSLLRESAAPPIKKTAIDELKIKIADTASLQELQDVVMQFKNEHQVDVLPEVDASVASKMIDITSDRTGETLNKLIAAALVDLELNPREMKRFLNVARLLFIRLDHNEDVSSDEHMLKVVRASHLILNWPQCLRWLQGNARSYTVKGDKADPVENLEALFNNPGLDNFEKWRKTIEDTWGKTVTETVAQPDFYSFTRRIHDNPPSLQDIFRARIF